MATTTSRVSIVRTNLAARQALRSSSSIINLALAAQRVLRILLYLRKRISKDSKKNLKALKKQLFEGFLSKTINSKSVKLKI